VYSGSLVIPDYLHKMFYFKAHGTLCDTPVVANLSRHIRSSFDGGGGIEAQLRRGRVHGLVRCSLIAIDINLQTTARGKNEHISSNSQQPAGDVAFLEFHGI